MKAKRLVPVLGLLFVTVFAGLSFVSPRADAAVTQAYLCNGFSRLGRSGCHGYFKGTYYYGTYGIQGDNILDCTKWPSRCVSGESVNNAIPSWINTAGEFENFIHGYLFNTSSNNYNYNKAGAAFIVDAMLGVNGTNFGSSWSGIGYARSHYSTWKHYVDEYANAGRINWNITTTLGAGTINSMHACWPSIYADCSPSAISSADSHDFAFFRNPSSEYSHVIRFNNPGGGNFEIRRECANILGPMDRLRELGWTLTGTTTKSTSNIYPTQSVTFRNYVRNRGPGIATYAWRVRYCWDACSGGYSSFTNHAANTDYNIYPNGSPGRLENTWTYTAPANITHNRICVWIAYSNATGPGGSGGNSPMQCVAISKPVTSCFISVPSNVIAGRGFTVTDGVTYQDTTAASVVWGSGGRAFISVKNSSGVVLAGYPRNGGVLDAKSIDTGVVNPPWTISSLPAGRYTIIGGVENSAIPSGNKSCSSVVDVGYKPYFNVLGGDVAAGPGYCGESSTDTTAGITANNLDASGAGPFHGAGSQAAAMVLGKITSFVTSQNGDGSDAGSGRPSGLAFANYGAGVVNLGAHQYGGSFGVAGWCVPDYYNAAIASATDRSSGAVNISSLPSGTYHYHGTTKFFASAPIQNGEQLTLLVDGGSAIVGDIGNPNITYAGYNKLSQIPSVRIQVSGGNMYINANTSTLHGFYDAQPDSSGNGGKIYTCANGTTPLNSYGACKRQLTFYGAVSAAKLVLGRTYGSLISAGGTPAQSAEKFVFTPELWLGNWQPPTVSTGTPTAQAYTSLPPIL